MKGTGIYQDRGDFYSLRLRYCIDNGIMIAQAGLLSYRMGYSTPLEDTICTQRLIHLSLCSDIHSSLTEHV